MGAHLDMLGSLRLNKLSSDIERDNWDCDRAAV